MNGITQRQEEMEEKMHLHDTDPEFMEGADPAFREFWETP